MARLPLKLLLFTTFVTVAASGSSACPVACNCTTTNFKNVSVDCRGHSLFEIPSELPDNTTSLDLRSNPVKCDCQFYHRWKKLRTKGIALQGKCNTTREQDGPDFKDLTNDYFKCVVESVETSSLPAVTVSITPSKTRFATKSSFSQDVKKLDQLEFSPTSSIVKPSAVTTTPGKVGKSSSSIIKTGKLQPTHAKPSATSSPTRFVTSGSVPVTTQPTTQEPPTVRFEDPGKVTLGETVQVKCIATGNPPPEVQLKFNDQLAQDADGVKVKSDGSEITIEFKAKINSTILCEAENGLGRDKRKMKISVDQTGAKYILFRVKLTNQEFNANMNNKDSKEFQDLARRIKSEVQSAMNDVPRFLGANLMRLWPGSVKADILIKTFQDTGSSVERALKEEVKDAKLGNIGVDRYLYSIEPSQACPSVFENVTWDDMVNGDFDLQPCPRGARGFAKRNCSAAGYWYYPDFTNCKSDGFDSLRDQFKQYSADTSNKGDTEKNILTGLQQLLTLLKPHEDFAVLAGDADTSAEMLETVVNYLTKENKDIAHSEAEIKHVIDVANHVLHWHNEQELIMAQKFLQTASKFIGVLEKYGLQAAKVVSFGEDRNLAILITEHVVMGAGVADPEGISEDVIFPNYKWPELGMIKQQWNVTTFVVLSQQMLKTIKVDDGIRIAGFLFKTLTRVLSFESAFSDEGQAFEINSAVISAATDPKPAEKLTEPVIIASSNLEEVNLDGAEPICAFWDFNMNAPHGGWSDEGCNTSSYNRMRTTCQCDHMTNFAVLRKKLLPASFQRGFTAISDFIHCIYIACWIIIAFAAITFLILLVLSPWLKPDRTWAMHMCVCASVIVTFVLLLLGLASYNDVGLCNLFSFLVHYFYLCTFSWILAESVYMRTWDTNYGPKKKYWIGYFLLGWGLPGIPMLITWFMTKMAGFESFLSCWLSIYPNPNPLVWVFFAPALVFFLVSCFILVRVWRAVTGLRRQRLKADYPKTRFRVHVRYCIILMIMFLITWLVGILLIQFYWKALLCILFIICCIITGLMILLFYVVMDRQVRDAFRQCCCYCKRGRQGSYRVQEEDGGIPKQQEQCEYLEPDTERLVVDVPEEQPDHENDTERKNEEKKREHEEPLLRQKVRTELESSEESFDPLYESVERSIRVDVRPVQPKELLETEPVYAKVDLSKKQKPLRHPESDSDDDDLTPEEREARGIRGLTREQVIRMAKKSDASKKVLRDYESPTGSTEVLDPNRPVYLLNQQELDEELKQFRLFFAQNPSALSSAQRTEETEASSSVFRKETSTSVSKSQFSSFSPVKEERSLLQRGYDNNESTTNSTTKTVMSQENREVKTSVNVKQTSALKKGATAALILEETAIDSSLEELDRRNEENNKTDLLSKPTAV